MARTTVNIDSPLLNEIKRLQRIEKKPLGTLISELLAEALVTRGRRRPSHPTFEWIARPMGARVDLSDRDAVLDAMDGEDLSD